MKRILLVGGGGFVGGYLTELLQSLGGYEISITHNGALPERIEGVRKFDLDLLQPSQIDMVLRETEPDYIVHLAAQSSVALSWEKPALTAEVNITGAINLLEAVRASSSEPRILLIGSGEEYGAVAENDNPIREDHVSRPGNFYAATKVAQEFIGTIYSNAYGMPITMVRAFNHIGPGQSPIFVVADFCKQVAEIEFGLRPPTMHVGNLSAKRDFTDVRDVVRAYTLLLDKGEAGELYNVGSGKAVTIQSILDIILSQTKAPIDVQIDPTRFRPVDVPLIEADIGKLVQATSWKQEIDITDTIQETLEYWRESVRKQAVGA